MVSSTLRTYLVESGENIVGKLYLSNRCCTSHSYTDTKTHNALLTKGGVEDSVFTWGRIEQKDEGWRSKL